MILALAGGVGGAKLANGLAAILPADELTIVVNTGDDFEHLGLYVAPDVDTVMYTLAGRANPELGWGLAGETWNFMTALEKLGGDTWFRLGDLDLATHVERTHRLRNGASLSRITGDLCRAYGVIHPVAPMSDDIVRTIVHTSEGDLEFQRYFVERRCEPAIRAVEYRGAAAARPSAALTAALQDDSLRAVVICPSNPWLSIGPILAISGVRKRLATRGVPIIAVSPIIAGQAVKGPAAKIMRELGYEVSAAGVAEFYRGLVTRFVIDQRDQPLAHGMRANQLDICIADTFMRNAADQARLARICIGDLLPSAAKPPRR